MQRPDHTAVPPTWRRLVVVIGLLLMACGDASSTRDESPLADLEVTGVDFELNSVLITNIGSETVRTEGLYLCQRDECFEFNIFSIAPRATIIFSVSRAGEMTSEAGNIALFDSDDFTDADSMIDYVAWGSPGQPASATAAEAELWSSADFVETPAGTIILTRIEPGVPGSDAWDASDELS